MVGRMAVDRVMMGRRIDSADWRRETGDGEGGVFVRGKFWARVSAGDAKGSAARRSAVCGSKSRSARGGRPAQAESAGDGLGDRHWAVASVYTGFSYFKN